MTATFPNVSLGGALCLLFLAGIATVRDDASCSEHPLALSTVHATAKPAADPALAAASPETTPISAAKSDSSAEDLMCRPVNGRNEGMSMAASGHPQPPYVCQNPELYHGQKIGNGQCVAFVKKACKAPAASSWNEGTRDKGNGHAIPKGTAIATFVNGKYPNRSTGNHAAVYLSQDGSGIWVMDQWTRQGCVTKRRIFFKGGVGRASNDGDQFSVIE
jgi:hypothetical protein